MTKKPLNGACGLLLTLSALLPTQPTLADDVEIYQVSDHTANLLMLLDVSGSMCFDVAGNTFHDCHTEVDPELRDTSRGHILQSALANILDNADPSIAVGMTRFGWDGSYTTSGGWGKPKKKPTYDAYGHGIRMPVLPLGENSKSLYQAHVAKYGKFGDSDYQTNVDRQWKDSLKAVLDKDFRVRGFTPLVDGLYESALYWLGESPDNGKLKEYEWDNDHNNKGVNATALRGATAHDMALEGNNGHYLSPATGDPCETNAIVLLTDGEPTVKRSLNGIYKIIGSHSCPHPGYTIGSGRNSENVGECGVELAHALHEGREGKDKKTINVDTYTIGFALPNNSDAKAYLKDISSAGGGKFYDANNEEELVNSFNSILAQVSQSNSTFSTGAVSTNGTDQFHHQDSAYLANFQPGMNATWPGNVKKYKVVNQALVDKNGQPAINPSTGEFYDTSHDFWNDSSFADGNEVTEGGAASHLDTNRTLWVDNANHNGLETLVSGNLTQSDFADLCAFEQYSEHKCVDEGNNVAKKKDTVKETIFGNKKDQLNLDFNTLVRYTQGIEATGSPRKHIGDPLHSLQVAVTYPGDKQLLMFNTNEGYLHAVDTSNGKEQWAFIPRKLLPNQVSFFRNQGYVLNQKISEDPTKAGEYRATYAEHIYGLDGQIQVWHNDTNGNGLVDKNETALLIIGMRRGGRDYTVLNISDPSAPKIAFTIEGGQGMGTDFNELGYTWSPPSIYTVKDGDAKKHVMVIGGGYDEIEDNDGKDLSKTGRHEDSIGRAIYIVGLEGNDKGKVLWKADYTTHSKFTNSVPAGVTGIDTDGDYLPDRLYTVDVGGRLWMVKLDEKDISKSTLVLLADLNDGSASGNRRFYYAPAVTTEISGGKAFKAITVGSGFRAHPLDETVQDRVYMLMDDDSFTEIKLSDIVDADKKTFDPAKDKGWYFNLENGEKSLSSTVIFNHKLLLTTYVPGTSEITSDPNVCSGGSYGDAYIYAVNLLNGDPVVAFVNDDMENNANRRKQLTLHDIPGEPVVMISGNGPELLAGRDVVTDKDGKSPLDSDSYREESWIDVQ